MQQFIQTLKTAQSTTANLATTAQVQQLQALAQQYLTLLQAAPTPNAAAITQTQQGLLGISAMLSSGGITASADAINKEITTFTNLIQGMSTAPTATRAFVGVKVNGTLANVYAASVAIATPIPGDVIYAVTADKTIVWKMGDPAPTSTATADYAYISTPTDYLASKLGDMKTVITTQYANKGVTLVDLLFQISPGVYVDSTGAPLFPIVTAAATTATAPPPTTTTAATPIMAPTTTTTTTAAAATSTPAPDAPATQSAKPPTDNTPLYIGLGVTGGIIGVSILVWYFYINKSSNTARTAF